MGSSPILGESILFIVSCYGAIPVKLLELTHIWSAVAKLSLKNVFNKWFLEYRYIKKTFFELD